MTEDQKLIEQIAENMRLAWNEGDSARFCVDFADDVDFIDVLGNHHKGRAAVEQGHRHIFSTFYKGSQQSYSVEGVRFVGEKFAIAFLLARLVSRLAVLVDDAAREANVGESWREDQARPTLILEKRGERWWIIAFQNTRIAQPR